MSKTTAEKLDTVFAPKGNEDYLHDNRFEKYRLYDPAGETVLVSRMGFEMLMEKADRLAKLEKVIKDLHEAVMLLTHPLYFVNTDGSVTPVRTKQEPTFKRLSPEESIG